ncbi:hypothetical protein HRbin17_01848 [bacterium HR17]|uniref:Uncharacterized protein n=1 Tax=Candidatus Fervidibacter japonicus TaxID=2035412 RepID=A0A2H5XDS5_9BACT|nr:hypothetical protein HRbin17_01848 [bacterium HR17]
MCWMRRGLVALTLCVAGVVGAVKAEPSLFGYTGLVFAPTADTVPRNRFNASWHVDTEFVDTSSSYTMAYGLQEGIEISVSRFPRAIAGASTTLLNLKVRIREPELGRNVQVAAGITDITDESKGRRFYGRVEGGTRAYLVLSAPLWQARRRRQDASDIHIVRGHLGFVAGRGRSNLFAALEAQLVRPLSIFGEVFDNDYHVGARLAVLPRVTLEGKVVNLRDPDVIIGVSYNQRW